MTNLFVAVVFVNIFESVSSPDYDLDDHIIILWLQNSVFKIYWIYLGA
jgi:hypothetical protein